MKIKFPQWWLNASRKKRLLMGGVILLLLYFFIHSWHTTPSANNFSVKRDDITEKITAVGNITPRHYTSVKSPVSGNVGQLFHDEGEAVKQGDALLEVAPAPAPADYAIAKQDLEAKQIDEQQKLKKFNDYQFLLRQHAIATADQNYLTAKSDYETAVSARKLAEQKLQLLRQGQTMIGNQLISNTIVSPINGYILQRQVDVGDPVIGLNASQEANTLFTIANMGDLIFTGQVNEIDAVKIKKGMTAEVQVAAYPDQKITGTLNLVALESEQLKKQLGGTDTPALAASNNNTNQSPFNVGYSVQINNLQLPPTVKMRSGYSATATIVVNTLHHVLIIPESFVEFDEQSKPYVWLVTSQSTPQKTMVELGISDGVNVEVKSGLQEGQQITQKITALPPNG